MGTNDTIRKYCARLIELGVNQKTLARRMGLSQTWFSRWVNGKGDSQVISVSAADGFRRYLTDVEQTVSDAQRSLSDAAPTDTTPRKSPRSG